MGVGFFYLDYLFCVILRSLLFPGNTLIRRNNAYSLPRSLKCQPICNTLKNAVKINLLEI